MDATINSLALEIRLLEAEIKREEKKTSLLGRVERVKHLLNILKKEEVERRATLDKVARTLYEL